MFGGAGCRSVTAAIVRTEGSYADGNGSHREADGQLAACQTIELGGAHRTADPLVG